MLHVEQVSKTFTLDKERIVALEDVSFEVAKGEFFTLIGPSGCGKSTLLRIVAGLDKETSGKLAWEEQPKIGFVFQQYALFPYLTVFENIAFGLKMEGVSKHIRSEVVKELIAEVGLTGYEDKHPKELSGGMKQRVGIARSLAINPNVLLLDEPFSSLDEFTAQTLRANLLKLWGQRRMTIILVTHLVREAIMLSDRVAVMTPSPGSIERIIENTLKRPRNDRSEEFYNVEDTLLKLVKA